MTLSKEILAEVARAQADATTKADEAQEKMDESRRAWTYCLGGVDTERLMNAESELTLNTRRLEYMLGWKAGVEYLAWLIRTRLALFDRAEQAS